MIAPIYDELLEFSKLACHAPSYGKVEVKNFNQTRGVSVSLCFYFSPSEF